MTKRPQRQAGFAYIAAVLILVALSTLAITVTRLSTTQQTTAAQDALQGFALQTARAGTEWGLYQALKNSSCVASQTLDYRSVNGFSVTVTCTRLPFNEGELAMNTPNAKSLYTISAIACNAAVCPNNALVGNTDYVERRRVATACTTALLAPC
ncbi:hypothetical protein [Pseudoduganella namucuonensis]|uniref:MSHA biogenesis protein MshP n=1 Tax=Pseudoduganella namucuonensis TaxID=1035707 RepID=A0A1I7L5U9_9BURK|nr:hypothetical protein [Pseudoduganella namucuonensis]SFV05087.1 MSHA biogenesis protein MshP [Pseudoduganella namucuonensis]